MVRGVLVTRGFACRMTLRVLNRPPDCLVDAGFWRFCRSGRAETSGAGGVVGVVLVTRGFAGRIALRIQNDPPGAESPS